MSGMPAPAVAPPSPVVRPEVVQPRPKKPGNSKFWIVLAVTILLLVTGAYIWRKIAPSSSTGRSQASAFRTAQIFSGTLERTIRLTGVTAAANYASLIAPRLRGSRSDRGRASSDSSTASAGSSSSSTSTSSSSNAVRSSSAPNASAAFAAATTRVGGSGATSTARSPASSAANSTGSGSGSNSTAMGSSGLGSTSDALPGGGGGGGGGGDFMLVLQDVAPAGSIVRKGDQVAEFDRQYMLLRLDDYQASVTQSEASLKKRKANLDISHKSHEQLVNSAKAALEKARLDLKTLPVLSDIDAEKARLAFQQAEAKYQQVLKEVPFVLASEAADSRVAELDLAGAKLELARAQRNADTMLSRAPIGGLVVMQTIFRGGDLGQVQRGDQLWPGQFYMQVVDPASMVINASANQVDVEHLRAGQKARVHFDAYPDLELPAHVDSIAAMTKPGMFRAQFVKELAVRLKLDAMDKRVIPDLSVSVDIVEEQNANVSALAPLGAVFSDASQRYVYVQDAFGWRRRDVEVGGHNNLVTVIKSGIKPGEVVALDPPSQTSSSETSHGSP